MKQHAIFLITPTILNDEILAAFHFKQGIYPEKRTILLPSIDRASQSRGSFDCLFFTGHSRHSRFL